MWGNYRLTLRLNGIYRFCDHRDLRVLPSPLHPPRERTRGSFHYITYRAKRVKTRGTEDHQLPEIFHQSNIHYLQLGRRPASFLRCTFTENNERKKNAPFLLQRRWTCAFCVCLWCFEQHGYESLRRRSLAGEASLHVNPRWTMSCRSLCARVSASGPPRFIHTRIQQEVKRGGEARIANVRDY